MAAEALGIRLAAFTAAVVFLAVALGVRVLTGHDVVDSSGALAQRSETALYAATIYAGVFLVLPRARPPAATAVAVAFCWLVEFFQLTGIPAQLSAHSLVARLALGVEFDPADLLWYAIGVLPLAALHVALRRSRCGSFACRTRRCRRSRR